MEATQLKLFYKLKNINMEYKVNLTDEEEKLFLQVVGTRLEHVQKTLSDMEVF